MVSAISRVCLRYSRVRVIAGLQYEPNPNVFDSSHEEDATPNLTLGRIFHRMKMTMKLKTILEWQH